MAASPAQGSQSNESEKQIANFRSLSKFPLEHVEPIAKAAVAFIALVYTLGLLITNKYLISFGISDFSSLRPRYVFTGAWALWLIMLAALPGLKLWSDWGKPVNRKQVAKFIPALAISATVFNLTLFPLGLSNNWYLWVQFLMLTLATGVMLSAVAKFNNHDDDLDRVFSGGIAAILFIGCLTMLSNDTFYGSIPEGLGGGKPMAATLIFDTQGVSVWEQAGMQIAAGTTRNSQRVKIIYQDEHNLYVQGSYGDPKQPKTKMVIMSRSLVDLILPED